MKNIQKIVDKTFLDNFGYTPLKERINDITKESLELCRFKDINNLKEETGDLLSSLIQLCNESGWDFEDLVENTCDKIQRRKNQYKSLGRKYNIALLGGAFNPITKGHIEVAKYVLNTSGKFDEVWIIPAYKHIYNKQMESYEDRFEMCELASKKDGRIKVFDYEKKKDLAGETYNLMKKLLNDKDYENYEFSFIIGLDNANSFDKWVNFEELERLTSFVIVPRKGYKIKNNSWYFEKPHILLNDELEEIPIMEISSTQVRSMLERYRNSMDSEIYLDIKNTLLSSIDEDVFNYIINNKLYE
jgi:nicotinate-nucleotide adenylyltransferase